MHSSCQSIETFAIALMIDLGTDVPALKRIVKAVYDISKMKTDLSTLFDINKILIPTIKRLIKGLNNSLKYKTTTSKVHIV